MASYKSWGMDPIYFTPPPTKMDRRMWKDAPDPPQPDPRMFDIMQDQIGMSREALEFQKQAYGESKIRQQAIDSMQTKLGEDQLQDAATNRQRADEQYKFYMEHGRPVQQQALEDAQHYDSDGNITAFKGRAAADVSQQFGNAEQQQLRSLSRMGVMPNANRMAAITSNLAIAKAASTAGAMTNAEMQVRDRALGLRANAANMAAGLPSTSMQWGQAGNAAGQTAFGNAVTGAGVADHAVGTMGSGYSQAGSLLGQAAQTGGSIFNSQMQGYNAQQQANANSSAGIGSLVGMGAMMMMADGGKIVGPGNGVSDSIPAVNTTSGAPVRISNGEYVIPADVVRAKGEEFFQKLIERHHKPAALQRRTRG